MKILSSKKFKLPTLYFITERIEINDLPVGVPFIYGDAKEEEFLIRLLEYEVVYNAAMKSGYPFNFRSLLKDNGFDDLVRYDYQHPVYIDVKTNGDISEDKDLPLIGLSEGKNKDKLKDYIRDSSAYVDVNVLKGLNVFPVWLDKIEDAISTNVHNFAVFNNNMYNKKLEGMYGGIDLVSPNKNLIIIDISGSIPKAVSSTCLALSKNLAESFYADILITGSKSTLYSYECLGDLNVRTIYDENGMDNDQTYFKKLVSGDNRHYKTVIAFGDNHSPSMSWSNEYNRNTNNISREDGKKLCEWGIDKLISFHVNSTEDIAGYADWFEVDEVEKISNWVKYLE
jgi:hypothetical protein